jgi:beta-glucanase (GH16 family)
MSHTHERCMKALTLLLAASIALAQKPHDNNWVLTFADEFDGAELDLAKWSPHEPGGQARDAHPEAITVSGGQLHVTARRANKGYVQGIVTTFGTFAQRYGRFEIRCRVPAGRGLRAIVSLRPVALAPLPSIGLLEVNGATPSTISFANDWGTEQTRRSFGDSFPAPDLSAGFHTIAIEWDRDKILWSIDGKDKFQSLDGVPRQSMFLALELAVGGGTGSLAARTPDASTAFPASFDIDYVRIYQHK